ncbi:MAG: hypothetical protein HZB99_03710 [Candidatus Harrisonbacteria bacterium]|nr:hypothetical protein [Candidatus Harrisonbacteria bacterium]
MHKKELVVGLKRFTAQWKGQRAFANFLVHYLENLNIPNDEKYDFWSIESYLPELMVDAFEQLRTGTDDRAVYFRQAYELETGHEVPNITDLGASNLLDQGSAVQTTLGFMLKEITGQDWVEHQLNTYCNAQKYVLQQTFDKFLRLVYRRGLGEMADKCDKRGMSGKFGETQLRTFIMAGRIMFTFARCIDKSKDSYYKKDGEVYCNESTVSFVGEDGDPLCLNAGIQSIYGDFRTALDMIEDVIRCWPKDLKEQKKLYKADAKVAIG